MDNPLFPTPVDGSMAPGERRRAALRQAALKTAPLACSHPALDSPCSSSSVPHGSAQTASVLQQDAAHAHDGPAEPICTPFANPEITAGGSSSPLTNNPRKLSPQPVFIVLKLPMLLGYWLSQDYPRNKVKLLLSPSSLAFAAKASHSAGLFGPAKTGW